MAKTRGGDPSSEVLLLTFNYVQPLLTKVDGHELVLIQQLLQHPPVHLLYLVLCLNSTTTENLIMVIILLYFTIHFTFIQLPFVDFTYTVKYID